MLILYPMGDFHIQLKGREMESEMVKTWICESLARSQKSPQKSPEPVLHIYIVETRSKLSKRGTVNRRVVGSSPT